MKLSYDQRTGKFIVSELGRVIDSDLDLTTLGVRYGFIAPLIDDEMADKESPSTVEDPHATQM
ncbi:hypothetical protein FNW02_34410 [Komarekiella sp. 'clone 1']|uniref:Uncharacterized protein n=1 Tax=Komarekiella delphini-convector SJRDD-AB1 TaxID=2593771 RepID=A0AA40T4E4_9NOST|nr:hypothetical protein [Komarekiella delphini-convector]MBD6620719.1 hypothetical protein [Komarekiella delphini-convector SJRDD-AB1]